MSFKTMRQSLRQKIRKLRKKTTYPIGHFYSPLPDPAEAKAAADLADRRRGDLPGGIALDDGAMVALWHELTPHMADAPFRPAPGGGQRYHYDNPYFSPGDGLVLHAMLRLRQPDRFVEIGSGYSSAVALDTREGFGSPRHITCVEPYADRLRSLLKPGDTAGDTAATTILEQKVQDTAMAVFADLAPGDILFVDSSHVMKTGSDLNFIMHEILPGLPSGVIVHFHDIFWPFEYPREWTVDQNRAWNEVYALRNFLMYNRAFEILFFNDYFFQMHAGVAARDAGSVPGLEGRQLGGGSLWLRKTGD